MATHAFSLIKEQNIKEINSLARLWKHDRLGAELLSLVSEDDNKVFGVSFRTPVDDSTGVPHILEHAVLCGSRSYQVKDPFVLLLKGSLQTFLNAMTYPDKTCYPVASANLKDFYNLVDVYLDATFFPLISEEAFRQEGWRVELDSPEAAPSIQGVVYNEMKGVYSSPDSLLDSLSMASLFPDTEYGLESGGDPEHIPDLSYATFREFHQNYYHPSNARFFFSGNDPEEERLAMISRKLEGFAPSGPAGPVQRQKPLTGPIFVRRPYAASDAPDESGACHFTVNWLLPEVLDQHLVMSLSMLEHILIGLPASPLRKALIESGLGEDLSGVGLETELRQMFFSIGLKGIQENALDPAKEIIFQTLNDLHAQGINREAIEAAINSIEFDLRENNTGSTPRGLMFMLTALAGWLHGADPIEQLSFEADLAAIKQEAANGLFEDLIKKHFIDNLSRSTVLIYPDQDLAETKLAREKDLLERLMGPDTPEKRRDLVRQTSILKESQQTPDAPENVAAIPHLSIGDLERTEKSVPSEETSLAGAEALYHVLPTSGLVYLDLGFNLKAVPAAMLPLTVTLGQTLVQMGTDKESYEELGLRIARKTGGISPQVFISPTFKGPEPEAWLFVRGKATRDNLPYMLDILRDMLTLGQPDDQDRLSQIVLQEKSQFEEGIIPTGHRQVARRIRSRLDPAGHLEESLLGLEQIFYLRTLSGQVDSDWDNLLANIKLMRAKLFTRDNMIVNITAEADGQASILKNLETFCLDIPAAEKNALAWTSWPAPKRLEREWLKIAAAVNYVGAGLDLSKAMSETNGSIQAITRLVSTGWLWEQVRMLGGAYGAFCSFDRAARTLVFASYRDPNIERTLQVFKDTAGHLAGLKLSEEDLTRAVVGAMGGWDPYLLPDARGFAALIKRLTGDSPLLRQQVRDQLMSTAQSHFREFGDLLSACQGQELSAVISGSAPLDATWPETKLL